MAKPEPLPVVRGKDAKDLAERLEKRRARPEAQRLFTGALAELKESDKRRRAGTPSA